MAIAEAEIMEILNCKPSSIVKDPNILKGIFAVKLIIYKEFYSLLMFISGKLYYFSKDKYRKKQ